MKRVSFWMIAGLAALTLPLACAEEGAESPKASVPIVRAAPATRAVSAATRAATTATATAPGVSAEEEQLRSTLYYLASDAMEGRGVGTAGLDRAGQFIAERFAKAGLKPLAGLDGYFQTFDMPTGAGTDPATSLRVQGGAEFALGKDFTPLSISAEKAFEGPLVFAGYGITEPKQGFDDYANVEAKGKVLLVMRFEPHNPDGKSRLRGEARDFSPAATLNSKARNAAEHGAAAMLVVTPPTFHGPDHLMAYLPPSPDKMKVPVVNVTQGAAEKMLGRPLKDLQGEIDTKFAAGSYEVEGKRVKGEVKLIHPRIRNVLALWPGQGQNAKEFVVIGAHYDHLGHGGPGSMAPGSKEIFNGADDNASGTDVLLAVADRLAREGPLGRSVIFAAFTAEERGLVGSEYFVNHPPVELSKIVAMLNLDMVGRVKGKTLYVGGTGTAEPFDALVETVRGTVPLELKNMGRGGLGPSDHMSFALKKIPVMFFFSGFHRDYHRPSDDAEKINYAALEQVVDLAERVVEQMARMPRAKYVDSADGSSIFRNMGSSGSQVTLGVIPDYAPPENTPGVRINGTTPRSPAASAGLKEGDVITQFGERKIETIFDLSEALAESKGGQTVKVKVMREGKEMVLEATLAERKAATTSTD